MRFSDEFKHRVQHAIEMFIIVSVIMAFAVLTHLGEKCCEYFGLPEKLLHLLGFAATMIVITDVILIIAICTKLTVYVLIDLFTDTRAKPVPTIAEVAAVTPPQSPGAAQ